MRRVYNGSSSNAPSPQTEKNRDDNVNQRREQLSDRRDRGAGSWWEELCGKEIAVSSIGL